ncbi:guanylate kinase [Cardiobacterium hominis]|uniref:guanylate kinase n=1 Tax=Cardiobacterium hominis TaxID=2718 RepID=UPI0028D11CA6|nr:guanylate kinase [Cardiobacterium hominis]
MQGQLWIVAAPSGGGKTSLIAEAVRTLDNVVESVSHTTRAARPGEVEGVHYYFVEPVQFQAMIDADGFLEYAQVFHNAYGTAAASVDALLAAGKDVILSIDWQGAQQVMARRPDTRSVFLLPPSLEALRERLTARGQDNPAIVAQRMAEAEEQISHYRAFEFVIVNEDFQRAAGELQALILCDRLRRTRREADLQPLLRQLGQE